MKIKWKIYGVSQTELSKNIQIEIVLIVWVLTNPALSLSFIQYDRNSGNIIL